LHGINKNTIFEKSLTKNNIIMTNNLLNCITDVENNSRLKMEALKELRTLLEKLELGIESISKEDSEWSYTSQLEDIKTSLENVKLEIHLKTI